MPGNGEDELVDQFMALLNTDVAVHKERDNNTGFMYGITYKPKYGQLHDNTYKIYLIYLKIYVLQQDISDRKQD